MNTVLPSRNKTFISKLFFIFMFISVLLLSTRVYANNPVDINGEPIRFNTEYYLQGTLPISGGGPRMVTYQRWFWNGWDYLRLQPSGDMLGTPIVLIPASGNETITSPITSNENFYIKNTDSNFQGFVYWNRSNTIQGGIHLTDLRRAGLFQLEGGTSSRNIISIDGNNVYPHAADRWLRSDVNSLGFFDFIPVNENTHPEEIEPEEIEPEEIEPEEIEPEEIEPEEIEPEEIEPEEVEPEEVEPDEFEELRRYVLNQHSNPIEVYNLPYIDRVDFHNFTDTEVIKSYRVHSDMASINRTLPRAPLQGSVQQVDLRLFANNGLVPVMVDLQIYAITDEAEFLVYQVFN